MRVLIAFSLLFASPAAAQPQPVGEQQASPPEQPDAPYVTAGQDEPGYRTWYAAAPWRPTYVKAFNDYLTTWGVAGVVPTWQLLRTASDWQKCGADPFELAPSNEWPNIVQTLRYIRDKVVPAIGPVEAVSAYRNPQLNQCAGGARESAHQMFEAVDLVPLQPMTREALIHELCTIHARSGERYAVGLGFYAFLRFHVDSHKFRKWGFADAPEAAAPCIHEPVTIAQKPTRSVAAPAPNAAAPVVPAPTPVKLPQT
jgi:hypothetical protein